jgi:hypothetical protein
MEIRNALKCGPGREIDVSDEKPEVAFPKTGRSGLKRFSEFAGPMWQGYADEVRHERDASPR